MGSGQGGASVGAGGAGAGSAGLVGSTLGSGPFINSFDPIITGTFQVDHLGLICTSPFCGPHQNTTTGNFAYNQAFQWGTNMSVGFNNNRVTSDNPYNAFTPVLNSNFQLGYPASLARIWICCGRMVSSASRRMIINVRRRLPLAGHNHHEDQIENMYWDLVYAYENVRVQQEQLRRLRKEPFPTPRNRSSWDPGANRNGKGAKHRRH